MIKCNTLSFDTASFMKEIKEYYMKAMREAEDKFIELLEQEVLKTVHGEGPGKPGWRQAASEKMAVIEERFVDDYLEADVGYESTMWVDFVKTMLIAYGAGSAAGGSPITAGPPGRMVWDDNLDGQHPSNAKSSYDLPGGFNQPGNDFVNSAMFDGVSKNGGKRMETYFKEIIERANADLPSAIFYGNVTVSAG